MSDLTSAELTYAQQVGGRLRLIRKQKNFSLQDVEIGSDEEFKASVLGAYERGERAISVPRLYRLARYYGVPVDRLLPRPTRLGPGEKGDGGRTEISLVDEEAERTPPVEESVTIDLTRLNDFSQPETELLNRYLGMIQMQRQDFNGRMLTIRRDDLRAIAALFETTPAAMRRRLDDLGLRLVT